ncbi:MAG: outer membrane beta-barrel protein [Phenylobacterium sp.]|jgi:opacity protein-like surface antigen|uniref:outer membrane protein n=1 Tax=Phenylobacterium sp. TaxID=1871053 RepID=UPI0025FFA6F9|nr:outer membrane beta-barrel protein [Phenylobacterium sp.]MCA6299955.1 outer membrane beta-barrel protein [Phenylobacterium sp.]
MFQFRPKILVATLVGTLLAGGVAMAQEAGDQPGFYARVYGGISTLSDTRVSVGVSSASGKFSGSTLAGGAFGYDYEGPWRAEIEYTYRSSDVKVPASFAGGGDYASTAILVNGLYSIGQVGPLRPYVGAGIGFTREVDFDLKKQTGPSAPPSSAPGSYSSSGRLAYQAIAGAEVAFDDRWSGFGELRAFAIDSPNLSGSGGKKLRADYQTFDVLVGVSRRF